MRKTIVVLLFIALLAFGGFFAWKWWISENDLQLARGALAKRDDGEKILEFNYLFISKVLRAEKEVDFETRLLLENKVRELNEPEILAQWQKFIDSKTESEAQQSAAILLETMVGKMREEVK